MKKKFPGYYEPDETQLHRLWDSGLIVLDSNILLNLYRYSAETNAEILHTLNQLSDRLWITYNAAKRYHQQRLNVIEGQEKSYLELQKFLDEMQNDLKERLLSQDHSFLADQLIDKVVTIFNDIQNKLETNKEEYLNLFENDELKNKIAEILKRNVGSQYTPEELEKIYKEGKNRAQKQIPPLPNKEAELQEAKYHDLIIWKQTLKKAKATYKPILMLTDKRTDDWWLKFKGERIGPNPQLVEEMQHFANVEFYMYRMDPFMQNSRKYLEFDVDTKAIEEVQKFRLRDDNRADSRKELASKLRFQRETVQELSDELEELAKKTEIFSIMDVSEALQNYKTKKEKAKLKNESKQETEDEEEDNSEDK